MTQRPPKPKKRPQEPPVSPYLDKRRRELDEAEADSAGAHREAESLKARADAWAGGKPAAMLAVNPLKPGRFI